MLGGHKLVAELRRNLGKLKVILEEKQRNRLGCIWELHGEEVSCVEVGCMGGAWV